MARPGFNLTRPRSSERYTTRLKSSEPAGAEALGLIRRSMPPTPCQWVMIVARGGRRDPVDAL